jgi:hypothetical protein
MPKSFMRSTQGATTIIYLLNYLFWVDVSTAKIRMDLTPSPFILPLVNCTSPKVFTVVPFFGLIYPFKLMLKMVNISFCSVIYRLGRCNPTLVLKYRPFWRYLMGFNTKKCLTNANECKQYMNRIWSEYDQNMIRIWSEYDQNMIRIWTEYEQTMNRLWTEYEQNTKRIWTEYEHNKGGHWTEYE